MFIGPAGERLGRAVKLLLSPLPLVGSAPPPAGRVAVFTPLDPTGVHFDHRPNWIQLHHLGELLQRNLGMPKLANLLPLGPTTRRSDRRLELKPPPIATRSGFARDAIKFRSTSAASDRSAQANREQQVVPEEPSAGRPPVRAHSSAA